MSAKHVEERAERAREDGGMTVIEDVALPEAPAAAPPRRRRKVPWGFIVAGVAITAAVIYLIVANTSTTAAYYMTINELRGCHTCSGRIVRVAGDVMAGSVVRDDATQTIRFSVTEGKDVLPVTYSGVVPDIFRPGITVVVEGKLPSSGVFQASTLLAKCPSKFQQATPGASQS
jgi:cytochrome c-type biogenesis protein CcmE